MSGDITLYVRDGVVYIVALVLSICVHEFGHALVADKLGDPLPRGQGRVTLNPIAHIDPFGTIVMPLLGFIMSIQSPEVGARMLGWGKPVQVSLAPRSLTKRFSVKMSHAIIAFSGPLMNILFAVLLSGIYLALVTFASGSTINLAHPIASIIAMNIGLAFFNLIPCHPLDGGAILHGLLPRSLEFITETLETYGPYILIGLLVTGLLPRLMWPARFIADRWLILITSWVI